MFYLVANDKKVPLFVDKKFNKEILTSMYLPTANYKSAIDNLTRIYETNTDNSIILSAIAVAITDFIKFKLEEVDIDFEKESYILGFKQVVRYILDTMGVIYQSDYNEVVNKANLLFKARFSSIVAEDTYGLKDLLTLKNDILPENMYGEKLKLFNNVNDITGFILRGIRIS